MSYSVFTSRPVKQIDYTVGCFLKSVHTTGGVDLNAKKPSTLLHRLH